MGKVEGASYTVIIVAALGLAGAICNSWHVQHMQCAG